MSGTITTCFIVLLGLWAVITLSSYPLGIWIARLAGIRNNTLLGYRLALPKPLTLVLGDWHKEQTPFEYLVSFLSAHACIAGILAVTLVLMGPTFNQGPSFIQGINWVVSVITSTHWQSNPADILGQSATLFYLAVLAQFFTASSGLAVAFALLRAFVHNNSSTIGNYWRDTLVSLVFVLLPLAFVGGLLLVSQGVPQCMPHELPFKGLEGQSGILKFGPYAAWESIKLLGNTGGAFHPASAGSSLVNPTPLSLLFHIVLMMLLPVATIQALGHTLFGRKSVFSIYFMLSFVWLVITIAMVKFSSNPIGIQIPSQGGNLHIPLMFTGTEYRFSDFTHLIYASASAVTNTGSTVSDLGAAQPITVAFIMAQMSFGGALMGSVGAGLVSLMFYLIMTEFFSGMLIGRCGMFCGNRLQPEQVKLASIGITLVPIVALAFRLFSLLLGGEDTNTSGHTSHLYTFLSCAVNNGSSMFNPSTDTSLGHILTALSMIIGKFGNMSIGIIVAGSMANTRTLQGFQPLVTTFPAIKIVLLGIILISLGLLGFLPLLLLGPLQEHLMLVGGA